MDRNYEFEMEYLIGLAATIFGASSIQSLSQYVVGEISLLLIIVIISHVVLLTGVYSFRRATNIDVDITYRIEQMSNWTLWLSTITFLAFLIGFITNLLVPTWFVDLISNLTSGIINLSNKHIGLVVGIISIFVMVGAFYRRYLPAIRASRNIDISFAPSEVRVGDTYSRSKPIRVTITNYSNYDLIFSIELNFPCEISWKFSGSEAESEISGEFQDDFSLGQSEVKAYNLEVKYTEDQNTKLRIPVDVLVKYKYGTYEDEIFLNVNTY